MKSFKNYVYTERAHFMCPNMHFGIMAQINSTYNEEQVKQSAAVLQKAHPFLQSLIAKETDTGRFYYQKQDYLNIPILEKSEIDLWQQDYDEISIQGWNIMEECLLKILIYPKGEQFQILFIAHHLLCDGRGLLQLAEEFAKHYVKGITPQFVEERLIQSLHDLPPNSDLPVISKIIIRDANRKWKKEQHRVMYDTYREFEKNYIRKNDIKREVSTVCNQESEEYRLYANKMEFP